MGSDERGKEKERKIFPESKTKAETHRDGGKYEFENVFIFLSAEPRVPTRGRTLLLHVPCSSSGSSSVGVGVSREECSHAH